MTNSPPCNRSYFLHCHHVSQWWFREPYSAVCRISTIIRTITHQEGLHPVIYLPAAKSPQSILLTARSLTISQKLDLNQKSRHSWLKMVSQHFVREERDRAPTWGFTSRCITFFSKWRYWRAEQRSIVTILLSGSARAKSAYSERWGSVGIVLNDLLTVPVIYSARVP